MLSNQWAQYYPKAHRGTLYWQIRISLFLSSAICILEEVTEPRVVGMYNVTPDTFDYNMRRQSSSGAIDYIGSFSYISICI